MNITAGSLETSEWGKNWKAICFKGIWLIQPSSGSGKELTRYWKKITDVYNSIQGDKSIIQEV